MLFENLITLTVGFVLFGSVSGDLCSKTKELRRHKNRTLNLSEHKENYQKYNTDVAEEQRYCGEGYSERFCDESEFVCEPVCPAGCENGTCVSPGLCACAEGFELRGTVEKAECVPVAMDEDVWLTKGLALTKGEHEDLDTCREACYCWKVNPEELCSVICGTEDKDCLEPEFSFCNVTDQSIVYKRDATTAKIYACNFRKSPSTLSNYNDYMTSSLCIIIGISIFIGLMLIAIVYLCVRIYQTRHETGAHDIPISLLMKF